MPATVTEADKLIWGIPSGTLLTCAKSVAMKDDGTIAFTAGKKYAVVSMHPIAEPAFVSLLDDQGVSHKMTGDHVAEYFNR